MNNNPYTAKRWLIVSLTFLAMIILMSLTGCSTVDGIGKDISSTAQWTKDKMGGSK